MPFHLPIGGRKCITFAKQEEIDQNMIGVKKDLQEKTEHQCNIKNYAELQTNTIQNASKIADKKWKTVQSKRKRGTV